MTDVLDPSLDGVIDAVARATQLAASIQRDGVRPFEKADRTPLTVADLAVQAIVASALEQHFPTDPLLAEEDASSFSGDAGQILVDQTLRYVQRVLPGTSGLRLRSLMDHGSSAPTDRFWTLDPIDGTEGFLRGAHYVVALALLEDGRPAIALLGCPTLGRSGLLMVARRGQGTWVRGFDGGPFVWVRASKVTSAHEARVIRSAADAHIDMPATSALLHALDVKRPAELMDGQAKHASVALGTADLFVRIPAEKGYQERIWDHAAGTLAVEEAGGQVTDLTGQPFDFTTGTRLTRNWGVVVSNRHLHAAALAALQKNGLLRIRAPLAPAGTP